MATCDGKGAAAAALPRAFHCSQLQYWREAGAEPNGVLKLAGAIVVLLVCVDEASPWVGVLRCPWDNLTGLVRAHAVVANLVFTLKMLFECLAVVDYGEIRRLRRSQEGLVY